ncbi:MAG: hypothetical protein FWD49_07070 [Firmicutes bacterium]|nr:hypothetical protein [Bacillota bacterium]
MITQLWAVIQSVIVGFFGAIGSSVEGAIEIFYNETGGFTVAGQFLLVAFGVGIAFFGIRLVTSLVRIKSK